MFINLLVVFSCFRDVSLMSGFRHGGHKRICAAGSWHFAGKNVAEHHVVAVNRTRRVVVLLHYRTFQRQAREYAFRTRIGQHFSVQQYVGSGGSVSAYRARCHRSLTSHFELAGKQMLETTIVHNQHDQIHTFDSDLQSPASTAYRDKCGSAPALRRAARSHSASVLGAKDEAAFD